LFIAIARYLVAVVLVLDDDALLSGTEERHLERLVGGVLHGHHHALEDRPLPGDLALDDGLVERPVLRPFTGRAIRREAAQVLRDEVEDRLQLEAGGLPLVVLRAVAEDVQPGLLLLVRADLAGVLVRHPQVVAAVDRLAQRAENASLQPVRPRKGRHCRDGEQDLFAANLH
jgi:hypothetical protein